jgi:hypothetical protein
LATWERRLTDLAELLRACSETYFEPDNFRRNLNHFLQTSRTVTFLIQKQKGTIPDFQEWYSKNVTGPWSQDPVMEWAKDSRNKIEKEGDLEMRSTLTLSLISSYLSETDTALKTGRQELLHAGLTKLRRHAEKMLPTAVFNSSAIRVERAWVANSFPGMELLSLLAEVYSRVHCCCASLNRHLGMAVTTETSALDGVDMAVGPADRIAYLKLHDRSLNIVRASRRRLDRGVHVPPELQAALSTLAPSGSELATLESRMDFLSQIVERIFDLYQNHQSFLFLFSDHWRSMRMVSMQPADRVEKYIFWRSVADLVRRESTDGIIFIGEMWLREQAPGVHVEQMRIMGEAISMMGLSEDGSVKQRIWKIDRSGSRALLTAAEDREIDRRKESINFLVPIMRAFGLTDSAAG